MRIVSEMAELLATMLAMFLKRRVADKNSDIT